MTEEERKRIAAERKAAYRKRKREEQESLANPASIPPGVLYKDNLSHPLADEPALLADSILNSYTKDFCNTNALLKDILAHLIRIEIAMEGRR